MKPVYSDDFRHKFSWQDLGIFGANSGYFSQTQTRQHCHTHSGAAAVELS